MCFRIQVREKQMRVVSLEVVSLSECFSGGSVGREACLRQRSHKSFWEILYFFPRAMLCPEGMQSLRVSNFFWTLLKFQRLREPMFRWLTEMVFIWGNFTKCERAHSIRKCSISRQQQELGKSVDYSIILETRIGQCFILQNTVLALKGSGEISLQSMPCFS